MARISSHVPMRGEVEDNLLKRDILVADSRAVFSFSPKKQKPVRLPSHVTLTSPLYGGCCCSHHAADVVMPTPGFFCLATSITIGHIPIPQRLSLILFRRAESKFALIQAEHWKPKATMVFLLIVVTATIAICLIPVFKICSYYLKARKIGLPSMFLISLYKGVHRPSSFYRGYSRGNWGECPNDLGRLNAGHTEKYLDIRGRSYVIAIALRSPFLLSARRVMVSHWQEIAVLITPIAILNPIWALAGNIIAPILLVLPFGYKYERYLPSINCCL